MAVLRSNLLASRTSRFVVALTVATCVGAAFAAAPTATTFTASVTAPAPKGKTALGDGNESLRPLARGTAIRVARAYDAEDEDCLYVVTKKKDDKGRVKVTRNVSCAQ